MNFKKLGAEAILIGIIFPVVLPWLVWVTISIFNSQKAEAVIDNKFENIISILTEIKLDVKELKQKQQ